MTKKSKPASLTSSLLARKGEAEPAETPYSIAEASGTSTDSSSTETPPTKVDETPDVSEAAGTGNGQSMEGFGRLPLGDQDETAETRTPESENTSGGFTLPEGIQAGDPPITEPTITEPLIADPATDPVQDTALDLSNLGSPTSETRSEPFDTGSGTDDIGSAASASETKQTSDDTETQTPEKTDNADDTENPLAAAVALETQDAAPPPIMPTTLADEEPIDASVSAAADAEREAARDARLLRFVYIMAALTGIVAIVLYAGGWFVDQDTPQVAEQTPATETVASAGSTDTTTSSESAADSAKPGASSESGSSGTASSDPAASSGTPTPEPSAPPSGTAAIPAAPPIAAPGFGESGTKSGATAITTGGKAKATAPSDPKPDSASAGADKKSVSGIEVETLKPPATPTLKAPETPTVTAKAPESAGADASKSVTPPSGAADAEPAAPAKADGKEPASGPSASGTDSKVAVVAPEKPVEPTAKSVVDPAEKAGAAAIPADTPKVPDVQPPPVLTAPKLPSAQKPAAAAKPAKKVPNLRVLAPALVRPDPPQTSPAAKPAAGAANPSATAQIPKGSKTAALTPPKKPTVVPSKSSGKFLIQLSSVKSQKRAEAEWARLKKAFPKEFGGRDLVVEKRTIAGRGTFYRVQTGRFETLKAARAMCASLKGKKQACLPVSR